MPHVVPENLQVEYGIMNSQENDSILEIPAERHDEENPNVYFINILQKLHSVKMA